MKASTSKLNYAPGEMIFKEGEMGHHSYLIEDGEVEIFTQKDGKFRLIDVLEKDEIFGEMAIIDRFPRSASARAKSACKLSVIEQQQLNNRLQQADPVIRMIIEVLIKRLRREITGMDDGKLGQNSKMRKQLKKRIKSLVVSDSDSEITAINKIKIENMLRNSIANNELDLHFQPIIHLSSGYIAGFEALLRWNNPEAKLICKDFIAICEETDLIIPIGQWVMENACPALAELQKHLKPLFGSHVPFVSINVSGRQIPDSGFFGCLEKSRKASGLLPTQVKLEITEQIFAQSHETTKWAETARSLGYTLALDDFGTGYSSFKYLGTIPVDFLKIDRSFILGMLNEPKNLTIAKAIVSLGEGLNIPVVAEGVETHEHVKLLQAMNCEYVQGFLFSRPQPLETLIKQPPSILKAA